MKPRFRLFTADQHIGLMQNLYSLQLNGLDLQVDGCCLSNHWWAMWPRSPVDDWHGFRRIKPSIDRCRYDFDRYDQLALWIAATHGAQIEHNADAVYVSFLPHLVHLYRFLKVKVVLHASFRLGGTTPSPDFQRLLGLVGEWHDSGRLTVTATNAYDADYIRFFTGIEAEVIGIDCAQLDGLQWRPQPGKPWLLAPMRFSPGGQVVVDALRASLPELSLATIKEAYPGRCLDLHQRLCEHPGVIVVPYSVHCITVTECLRAGIPMFVPSHRLLVEWQRNHYLFDERKSEVAKCTIDHDRRFPGWATMPNPDDDDDEQAYSHWLKLCDWYQWPVQQFDSVEELRFQLAHTDLQAASNRQRAFNAHERAENSVKWERTLLATL